MGTWERLLAVRDDVNAALEEKRKDKDIGTSLGARVVHHRERAGGRRCCERIAHELPMLFIVSDVALHAGAADGADERASVAVEKAPGVKCDRCWRFVPSVQDRAGLGRASATAASTRSPALDRVADVTMPGRAIRRWTAVVIVVPRPARQGSWSGRASTYGESIGRHSRIFRSDAGAQHRRAFGFLNGVDFPYKTVDAGARRDGGAGRAGGVCRDARPEPAADAARPGVRDRRRGRQPDRSRRGRLRARLRRPLLARLALLGVQRGRRGDHRRRRADDSRSARSGTIVYPELFSIGLRLAAPSVITVYTYGVLLAASYLLGLRLAMWRAKRWGLDASRVLDLGIYIIIAALVGAKLLLLVVDFDQFRGQRPAVALPRSGGVFYGGLILAVVVAFWYIARHRMPFWTTCDVFAPAIALGHVTGRLGCLAAGCCYGKPTDVPWAIIFTNPLAAANVGTPLGIPLHPTQLYEAGAALLILVAPAGTERRGRPFAGRTFWAYMFLYAVSRYVIEIYRGDPRGMVFGFSTSQFISLVLAPLSLADAVLAVAGTLRPAGSARRKRVAA